LKLLTSSIRRKLENNYKATLKGETNIMPPLKIFGGPGTWVISELEPDGDTLFGLCDLGLGCPELGYVSLRELQSLRVPPFNLPLERDLHFHPTMTLSQYAQVARNNDRIVA
jgi:hypothetical protein